MAVLILRRGSKGVEVERWQRFLLGEGFLRGVIDGDFGPATERASKAFQRARGLGADGIVGPATIGAALSEGFDIGFKDPQIADAEPLLPEKPSLSPPSAAARKRMFGAFRFTAAPTASNPEAIRIHGDWVAKHIDRVFIPELKGVDVFGRPSSGNMRFNRKAIPQLEAMWAAWGRAGLADRVLSYGGSFNARFIRGSRSQLSNHAFGSAFDINMAWNGLGRIPAQTGRKGSVRELVAIANDHGFFWGGHYARRPDGMHFEVAKLL